MYSPELGQPKTIDAKTVVEKIDGNPPPLAHVDQRRIHQFHGYFEFTVHFPGSSTPWLDETDPPKRIIVFVAPAGEDGSCELDDYVSNPAALLMWPRPAACERHVFPIPYWEGKTFAEVRVPVLPGIKRHKIYAVVSDQA
jgi:hypothetical protein